MISIIIPCYNEIGAIESTIQACKEIISVHYHDGEIIVVDDGSTDGSEIIIQKSDVVYIRNVENLGYGLSLKRGIKKAKFNHIVILDADNSYPVNEIPHLYNKYSLGYDLVIADRSDNFNDVSTSKKIFRRILLAIVKFTTGNKVPDVNSGMRIFDRNGISEFLPFLSDGFSFTTSQCIVYMLKKKAVGFHSISYQKRVGKSKVKIFRDSLRTLQFITELIVLFNPLKLFILISVFPLLLFVISMVLTLIIKSEAMFLTAVVSFLTIVLVISLGFLAVCFRK